MTSLFHWLWFAPKSIPNSPFGTGGPLGGTEVLDSVISAVDAIHG